MIDEELLDKIIPLPDEEEEMEKIQEELETEGFAISNFSKGGIFYHLARLLVTLYIELKEFAREILNDCFIQHASGDWLDIKAADFSKQRKEAMPVRGYITVYRSEYSNALQITKGHCFKTKADVAGIELKYYVVENTVIGAGEETGKVLVEAEETGAYYNISPGRITETMIHLEGVDHIVNEEGWIYEEGADEEEDEAFRARILSSWSELSTITIEEKLKNAVMGVNGALNVKIDTQHPRGQGTVDVIITGTAGEASEKLIKHVEAAILPLKGQYEDYLVKSAEIVPLDFNLIIYLAEDAVTDGVQQQAQNVIQDLMKLTGTDTEMNTLYHDSIIYALSSNIKDYRKTDILQPAEDVVLEKEKVLTAGEIHIKVRKIGQE
ncbi:MAG: hypothetical protein HFG77_07375 [Hungatella sp.]|jgi:Uncharacterized homolog of phage Mu protein gp47|nr:hypothetical protein [Dorea sp.]MCI9636202.1 hypothetical protein [Hungatella sp.]